MVKTACFSLCRPINTTQRKITPAIWDSVEEEEVPRLPEDINGIEVYRISGCKESDHKLREDVRKWQKKPALQTERDTSELGTPIAKGRTNAPMNIARSKKIRHNQPSPVREEIW